MKNIKTIYKLSLPPTGQPQLGTKQNTSWELKQKGEISSIQFQILLKQLKSYLRK